jgi:hypothetical protein
MRPSNSHTWPWPESLGALAAAAAFHRKLLENERVRVLHTLIRRELSFFFIFIRIDIRPRPTS